ncbi:hypothetical protein [uncultured Roseovarius sp.]|uniref:SPW repeat domain-containing protein n=1 Tax=uncultured Roseovarius sp. TaxID=293344 RepID=UPI0026033097|nr:hypothetical protein [uncultured Roseovarius sp.]
MPAKFVTKHIHAYLDYPVALALIGLPFLLDLGSTHPMAFWLSVVTGIAAFLLTVLTDHHLGLIRVIPYYVHMAVDLVVGLTFLAAPFLFGFTGLDAIFYWLNGAAVCLVIASHKSDMPTQPAE